LSLAGKATGQLTATRLLQHALSVVMLTCWLFAWSAAVGAWIDRPRGPLLSPIHLVLLLAAPAILTRVVATSFSGSAVARYGLAAIGLAASVLSGLVAGQLLGSLGNLSHAPGLLGPTSAGLRGPVAVILAVLTWWRGISVGRDPPSLWRAERDLRTGVLAFGVLLVCLALAGPRSGPDSGTLVVCALGLVAAGLVATPLARIYDEASQPRHLGRSALTPSGPWLTTLLSVVGGLLFLALLLSQVLTYERIDAVLSVLLLPVQGLLWLLLNVILVPIAYLVEALVWLLRSLIPANGDSEQQMQSAGQMARNVLERGDGEGLPPEVLLVLRIVAIALAAGLIMVVLAFAASRLDALWRSDDVGELRDIVWRWPTIREIWAWLTRRVRAAAAARLQPASKLGQVAADYGSVRGIYRAFLALGMSIGHGRRSPETPGEYQDRLADDSALEGSDDIGALTNAYVLARYGPETAEGPPIGALVSALERLRAAWRDRFPE
jgi:hypothetical protein